ncbi:hypothetical protein [Methylomonas sp. YC3]
MKPITPSVLSIAVALLLSACANQSVTPPEFPAEKLLGPQQTAGNPQKIGLAFSGGGTKAASYAMGVLAAAVQSNGGKGLSQFDAISSVSGGSYASLFLYSKLMLHDQDPGNPQITDYFADCMPEHYSQVLPGYANQTRPFCNLATQQQKEQFKFQQYLRCRQDVLQSDCKPGMDGKEDDNEIATGLKLVAETAAIFVPNFIARTVFDWPVNLSRTRHAYQEGIWSSYAWYPTNSIFVNLEEDIDDINDVADDKQPCYFLHCQANDRAKEARQLTFQQLENTLNSAKDIKYPTWFINATASRKRSFLGWSLPGQRDFTQYTMQMSPYGVRTGLYGDFQMKDSGSDARFDLDLLDAVTASAAFADANESVFSQKWGLRFFSAIFLHLAGQDWGKDIDNPNVAEGWRYLHNTLPFPLYYTDGALRILGGQTEDKTRSSYMHLMDGGNNDNLGAFSLIEAGMKNIFIADSAEDEKGDLEDVCLLHNEIRIRNLYGTKVDKSGLIDPNDARKLIIPGLEGLENHCLNLVGESANNPGDKVRNVNGPATSGHYSIYDWQHKVLVGCIRKGTGNTCDSSQDSEIDAKVFLLKPAINLDEIKTQYVDVERKQVKVQRCDKNREPELCNEDGLVKQGVCDETNNPGLCEVAAYIADSYDPTDKEHHGLGKFPQDSTAGMTANSDAKRYGAYRELGRWHMNAAMKLINDPVAFDAELAKQTQHKISYDAKAN